MHQTMDTHLIANSNIYINQMPRQPFIHSLDLMTHMGSEASHLLHCLLPNATWTASGNAQLHQCIMSLDHLLASLPWGWSSSSFITVFTRHSSRKCVQIAPTIVQCLSTFSLRILWLTLSFQQTFSILISCSISSQMKAVFWSQLLL